MEDKSKEEIKNNLKSSLKGILGDDDLPIEDGSLLAKGEDDIDYIEPYDTTKNLTNAKNKAKKVIKSMLKLFMSQDLIERSEFIQAKTNLDIMSITQILVSLKQIEYSINIILRDIGFGQAAPRIFEVFGQLQKTKVELIREYNLMLNQFEESMKRYKSDIEFSLDSAGSGPFKMNTKDENVHRGNKNLMREIQEEIRNGETEDGDFEEI